MLWNKKPVPIAPKAVGKAPPEILPPMGTADDPVIFGDHIELLLCYEIAPANGGGLAILAFGGATHYEINPWNIGEGLHEAKYPFRIYDFTEVVDSDLNHRWPKKRVWTISSNDVMIEIVFESVRLVSERSEAPSLRAALLDYWAKANS